MSDAYFPSKSPRTELRLESPSGHGSTNTCIRRYSTVVYNLGDLVYATSTTLGMSVTINSPGVYFMYLVDLINPGPTQVVGISINSNQLTTSIASITSANRIALGNGSNFVFQNTGVAKLCQPGDVIRVHDNGLCNWLGIDSNFEIVRIS